MLPSRISQRRKGLRISIRTVTLDRISNSYLIPHRQAPWTQEFWLSGFVGFGIIYTIHSTEEVSYNFVVQSVCNAWPTGTFLLLTSQQPNSWVIGVWCFVPPSMWLSIMSSPWFGACRSFFWRKPKRPCFRRRLHPFVSGLPSAVSNRAIFPKMHFTCRWLSMSW